MAKNRGPYLPNLEPFIAAGVDLKTGLPNRISKDGACKENIKIQLREIDRQDAVNRYVWYNLPMDLPSQEVERMLYYKGQLCFFYDKDLNQFLLTPFALDGTIDFYGRYNHIHPVPMTSGTEDKGNKALAEYLANKKLKCVYGMVLPDDENIDPDSCCVLLYDRSKQLSQTILPRAQIQDPLLDVMAECIPYMRTCLLAGSGIKGIRVNDADQADNVQDATRSMKHAALNQEPWIAVEGNVEMQELTDGATLKAEEYMLALQSLDNFRLSTYGIDNGGLFEKKAHELQSEADINGGPVGLVMQDGLAIRQNFCNIVNSIWDLGIWCEPAQNIMGVDNDGDGSIAEEDYDGSNTGVEAGGNDNE